MSEKTIYTEIVPGGPTSNYDGKYTSFVDQNLLSGSSDSLRTALGGSFYNKLDENQKLSTPPTFYKFLPLDNINPSIYSILSYSGAQINSNILRQQSGFNVELSTDAIDLSDLLRGVSKQTTLLPYVKFVCSIHGDPMQQHLEKVPSGNKYWKALFTGGVYANNTINKIYSNGVYDEHFMTTLQPYEKIETQQLNHGGQVQKISEIGYDYNHYNTEYQNHISDLESERNNVNWYSINLIAEASDDDQNNQDMIDYYGLDGINIATAIAIATDSMPEETINRFNETAEENTLLSQIQKNTATVGTEITQRVNKKSTNLLFNEGAVQRLLSPTSNAVVNKKKMPYYIKYNLDTETSGKYVDIIRSRKYSTGFLRTLKEVFLEQTNEQLPIDDVQFLVNQRSAKATEDTRIDTTDTTSETVSYRGVDMTQMLLYSRNTIKDENEDFMVMDYENLETKTAMDSKGVYRALNTRNAQRTINDVLETLSGDTAAFYVSDINTLMNIQDKTIDFDPLDVSNIEAMPKYNEVLAYRIEKIGGPPTGDLHTQTAIQNFWIFNDPSLNTLELIDTQIKYDTEYTYRVYAYHIVKGVKYQFSDLQLTRIIGNVKEDDTYALGTDTSTGDAGPPAADNPIKGYCVEFYDPLTDLPIADLLEGVGEVSDTTISSIANDEVRIRKSLASIVNDTVLPPYIANFVTTVQPSLKLVEIPIHTKTLSVTDYIPNRVNIHPSYELKNTNRLIFNMNYQPHEATQYPQTIEPEDSAFKTKFLTSNDLTSANSLVHDPRSSVTNIDVYRIDKKPTSIGDFSGNIITTINTRIPDTVYAYKTAVFSDIVKSNVKYYYLFRTRSELGVKGYISQIIQAELINDGGYKYALFDVINPVDMSIEKFKNTSENVKRVIQVTPNFSQVMFEDSDVDYTQDASSQFDKIKVGIADDTIWNKTFKLRLTSKKTGKKIDLNITYSDPNTNLAD